jgi:hypothetical protein
MSDGTPDVGNVASRTHMPASACRSDGTVSREADSESATGRRLTRATPSESSELVLICNV